MPFTISKLSFNFEWRNIKLFLIMKTLELNQMVRFQGGDVAGCIGTTASGAGVVLSVATLVVGVASGPIGWIGLALGAIGTVAGAWNGDPCDF